MLSIYHIMLIAICTTQVKKESKKEILKKRKKIGYEKLLPEDSNPHPQNWLELKVNPSIHYITSVNENSSSLKEVYIPSLWWLTVFKDDFFVFFFFFLISV